MTHWREKQPTDEERQERTYQILAFAFPICTILTIIGLFWSHP